VKLGGRAPFAKLFSQSFDDDAVVDSRPTNGCGTRAIADLVDGDWNGQRRNGKCPYLAKLFPLESRKERGQQHDRGTSALAEQLDRASCIGRIFDEKTQSSKKIAEVIADIRIVLDHENSHGVQHASPRVELERRIR